MTVKIAWHAAERSKHLKHHTLIEDHKARILANDDWHVTADHSSLFILIGQYRATLSKVRLEKV